MTQLSLAHGLSFEDLYQRTGLQKIDQAFLAQLQEDRPSLYDRLIAARSRPDLLSASEKSGLLLSMAPIVDRFIASLFKIEDIHQVIRKDHLAFDAFIECRRKFIQRKAIKAYTKEEAAKFDGASLEKQLGGPFDDVVFAQKVMFWLQDEAAHEDMLQVATQYAAWAYHTQAFPKSKLFWTADQTDYDGLVTTDHAGDGGYYNDPVHLDARVGFSLTDPGCDRTHAMAEASYCVHCHERNRDSCSHGLHVKKRYYVANTPNFPL